MGQVELPSGALYGAQTARAVANFHISGTGIGREMIWALGLVKLTAARINRELGRLEQGLAEAVASAAEEVVQGTLDQHFPVDVFQTGSGPSSNLNANEVIANRAIQILGGAVGTKSPVHPNDHVNLGQSSNDVFPTAIHLAALTGIERRLLPALEDLGMALRAKANAFDEIVKIGRTHLQDATRFVWVRSSRPLPLRSTMGSATCALPARICESWPSAVPRWVPGSTPTPSLVGGWTRGCPN